MSASIGRPRPDRRHTVTDPVNVVAQETDSPRVVAAFALGMCDDDVGDAIAWLTGVAATTGERP